MVATAVTHRARALTGGRAADSAQTPEVNRVVGQIAEQFSKESPIRYAIIGGAACRLYQAARAVSDVDVLVAPDDIERAQKRLADAGYRRDREHTAGSTNWIDAGGLPIELLSLRQPWLDDALAGAATNLDDQGAAVLPLPYLILLKIERDSSKHRWDIARMLALSEIGGSGATVRETRRLVADHRPGASRTIDQLLWIGRLHSGRLIPRRRL